MRFFGRKKDEDKEKKEEKKEGQIKKTPDLEEILEMLNRGEIPPDEIFDIAFRRSYKKMAREVAEKQIKGFNKLDPEKQDQILEELIDQIIEDRRKEAEVPISEKRKEEPIEEKREKSERRKEGEETKISSLEEIIMEFFGGELPNQATENQSESQEEFIEQVAPGRYRIKNPRKKPSSQKVADKGNSETAKKSSSPDRDEVLLEMLKELKELNANIKSVIVRIDVMREEIKEQIRETGKDIIQWVH